MRMGNRFSNPFRRYIKDLDTEATRFLENYGCADAAEVPQAIPIDTIAKTRMSLEVIEDEYLSSDGSVDGAIAFSEGTIEVFDWMTNGMVGYPIRAPTIFIDAGTMNLGRRNNTLAHECYHWFAHRQYFIYRMSHNAGAEFAFRCDSKVRETKSDDPFLKDIANMEWQAKHMAPKILMPKIAFLKKAKEIFNRYNARTPYQLQQAYPFVIPELAHFFEVSEQSVVIRLEELGYNRAADYWIKAYEGVAIHEKIDASSRSARKHQCPLEIRDAFKLYSEDDFFRETINTGAFVFADGYFVLNEEKYVIQDEQGKRTLTSLAKERPAECTLSISSLLISTTPSTDANGLLYRSDIQFTTKNKFESNTQNTELFNKARQFENQFKRSQDIGTTANAVLWSHMQSQKWNTSIFQDKTLLNPMAYSRVQNPTHPFKMPQLIAMGVGLALPLTEMNTILSLAGMAFSVTDKAQQAYQFLFTGLSGCTIYECNDFLESVGVATLGSKEYTKNKYNSER